MERSLERYYTKFERPPLAPIYYPTDEEFCDPIAYVAKIKSDAEQYGVVKIVPPASFRPPFVIDSSKFEFTPRVQRLNEIDALFRVRIVFINKLVNFWHLQGQQFRLPWVENKYIDLYRLRELVHQFGGVNKVNDERKWSQISRAIGFKPASGPALKQHYAKWILPYEKSIEKSDTDETDSKATQSSSSSFDSPEEDVQKCVRASMQGRRRQNTSRMATTSSGTRMMAGVKRKPMPSLDKSSLPIDILSAISCHRCDDGGDEARLLLCESCDRSYHTYCLDPPLTAVPKGEWRCPKCVANAVKKVSFEFGFHDSNQLFTLEEFGEWANNFKQAYFKQAPSDVPCEKVEAEFWQNVINFDKDVSVKYGADLITSKVGSGFPRKTDVLKGVDSKERYTYANHPWNLNNLPVLRESVLSHIDTGISGMMVPWVYVGMCFSTFCWHVEDHWTYSINYNHWGERKIWYGIAGKDAEKFDEIVKNTVPDLFVDQPDLLHHMTTALNPRYLIDKGLPIYTVHQNPGEFVITFPRAYHAGFNEGLNFAEAVNFAPPDWLYMGRICLNNYANIKRTCVFSHGELVMRMVQVADKMSIGMCLATLEELRHIINREAEFRKHLTLRGLRDSEFCKFEDIADDARSCMACKTTLYISALVCKHKSRIVCMNHVDQLCPDCSISDCSLRYRYKLEELVPLVTRLSQRTTSYEEWRNKVATIFAEQHHTKPDIIVLRELAETWKSRRYPQCDEIRKVLDAISRFDKISSSASKIMNRKIRLRDNTRCQKADNRCEFAEVENLRKQLQASDIKDEALERSLSEICDKISKWNEKALEAIESTRNSYGGTEAVDILLDVIYEGEEFNLRLPEVDVLKMELARCEWLLKAHKMLDWIQRRANRRMKQHNMFEANGNYDLKHETNICCDTLESTSAYANGDVKKEEPNDFENEEDENSEEETARFDIVHLNKTISDGCKWIQLCDLVKDAATNLYQMQQAGVLNEAKAEQLLEKSEGMGFSVAEEGWKQLQSTDWLDSQCINEFREEMEQAREINENFCRLIDTPQSYFCLKTVEQLEQQCEKCLFERKSQLHNKVTDLRKRLKNFVERISSMFQKTVGYYNIFDILSGRDDLPTLMEGEPLPLLLFTSTKYTDNWAQLKLFNTNALLTNHLTALAEQQANLLMALRLANEKRPLKETCSCGRDVVPKTSNESIPCFLCNASFHVSCAQWEVFFDRMPPGVYLCPRCLRGRRPCIEDVEAACESAPRNSLEHILVQNLLNRSVKAFSRLQKAISSITVNSELVAISQEQKNRIQETLIVALSVEVMDTEAYQMAFAVYFKLFPLPEQQIERWRQIQARMVEAKSSPIIFPPPSPSNGSVNVGSHRRSNGKRSSSSALLTPRNEQKLDSHGSAGKKRCKDVYHADQEYCAADKCLRPYSDQVRWIQCDSGCARWYHYVCVGQTVKAAEQISIYSCYRCSITSTAAACTTTT